MQDTYCYKPSATRMRMRRQRSTAILSTQRCKPAYTAQRAVAIRVRASQLQSSISNGPQVYTSRRFVTRTCFLRREHHAAYGRGPSPGAPDGLTRPAPPRAPQPVPVGVGVGKRVVITLGCGVSAVENGACTTGFGLSREMRVGLPTGITAVHDVHARVGYVADASWDRYSGRC